MFIDWRTPYWGDGNSLQRECTYSTVPIEIPAGVFLEIDKVIPKFIWKRKEPRLATTILKKKNKVGGSHYLISRHVIKLQWYRNEMIL